ncbi:DNA repair protein RecN [Thiovibrio frasassiensis]|uniref:DNA repair protein RecN n=1 Tax=Thiovibrio frasassiensis TaxID=2984131 RepID=A0A9X4MHK7_9BACT|nr:DNA repair protein RecN [Thiovibrio frasassiensis]MDG4476486.1 DNA repair protein RecN [Thiovibrio frasassiensis]
MLKELIITNLALIEKLHVSFAEGLTVLTGETGAGKSIILQAIHLLEGGKAAATWIRGGAETATVEALFELNPQHEIILEKLAEMGYDPEPELVVKRVVSLKGASRYFMNGSLATAKAVGEVMENLLSVASQHDHQQLLQPRSHLDCIDAVGGLWPQRLVVAQFYDKWQECKHLHQALVAKERDKEQRRDFLAFQVGEIEEAGPSPGEDAALILERDRLRASDDLIGLGKKSWHLLADAVNTPLSAVRKNLAQMAAFDPGLAGLAEEVAGNCFQLEDHVLAIRNYVETLASDPARLDVVTARLDLLQRLKRKYGGELDAVIVFGREARQELAEIEALDERLAALEKEMRGHEADLREAAALLSQSRQAAAQELAGKIRAALAALCFEQAVFEICFKGEPGQQLGSISRLGWDRPEFMFSANQGEEPKPLAKVASGGELSRLMLALKTLLAQKDQVDTVIFDEIDAGISGKAAEAVARKIRELSAHHQVFCITHLPQIASLADEHFLVQKSVVDARTQTTIIPLAVEKREQELARMLDGDSVSEQTLAYVRTLMERKVAL